GRDVQRRRKSLCDRDHGKAGRVPSLLLPSYVSVEERPFLSSAFLYPRETRAVGRPCGQQRVLRVVDRAFVTLLVHDEQPPVAIGEGDGAARARTPTEHETGHRRLVDELADR